jgi:endonuclease YncB( thermonuclease family)
MPRRSSVLLFTALLFLSCLVTGAAAKKDRTQPRPSLQRVGVPHALIDVGDGDTVSIQWGEGDRERVRILGIDTPEVAHPQFGMPYDQPFGREAAAFAAGAFAAADTVELLRAAETDGYGRTLGYFFLNGKNYSVLVLRAGFAVETVSHYGDNGLPEASEAVLAASRECAPAPFEAPYQFRRRMREIQDWNKSRKEEAPAPVEAAPGGGEQ